MGKNIIHKFWRVPIKAPQDKVPKKMYLMDQLLLSKLPPILREQVSDATGIAQNVYEIPSLSKIIRWMHAVCGYPAKSTWLKTIRAGNFAWWPLVTIKNVYKYYLITDKTAMGRLNQSRAGVRSTKRKSDLLPESIKEDLKLLLGKKN